MTDISFAMEAKSDQLNAVDIMGCDRIIRIRDVRVTKSEQPISIYFDGDNSRPWKPSKGMIRIIAGCWGSESSAWIGRHIKLYFDETVIYAGKPVGGIRISAMSDIPKNGKALMITINRQKREPFNIQYLEVVNAPYPDDRFKKALPAMTAKMQSGEMTLQHVIAQCQKTGELSAEQLAQLEAAAPIELDHNDEVN